MSNPILTAVAQFAASSASALPNPVTLASSYGWNHLMPIVLPDVGTLTQAFMTGAIGERSYVSNCRMHGHEFHNPGMALSYTSWDKDFQHVVIEDNKINCGLHDRSLIPLRPVATIDELNRMFNRKTLSEDAYMHMLSMHTPKNPAIATAYSELRFEIPGPSDLIRFAVKDCFTPDIVERFGYAKETPSAIRPWVNKQGYGESIGVPRPGNSTNENGLAIPDPVSWFDLYWWSHWELPSPTQGYEMLHRLYPNSRYGPSPFFNGANGFTGTDLSLLLKSLDYPEFWRNRLEAISYHNLNRSDVIPMYRDGQLVREKVYHALRADGYRDEEAMSLLAFADYQKAKALGIDPAKKTKEWICKVYSRGMIQRDDAIARLEGIGIPRRFADSFLDTCDLEETFAISEEKIKTLRRGFITGLVTEDDATNILNRMNLREVVITRYIDLWQHLKMSKYKNASTRQNLKAYSQGLVNRNEIIARLQNLGYASVAISTMLGLADYDIANRNLKRIQQELRARTLAEKQRLQESTKAQKEAARKAKTTVSNVEKINNKRLHGIIRASTDKNILDWYKGELIELWEVFYRLYYRDFTMADAMKWVLTKIPELEESEYYHAEIKAAKVYRSEPNPPLT